MVEAQAEMAAVVDTWQAVNLQYLPELHIRSPSAQAAQVERRVASAPSELCSPRMAVKQAGQLLEVLAALAVAEDSLDTKRLPDTMVETDLMAAEAAAENHHIWLAEMVETAELTVAEAVAEVVMLPSRPDTPVLPVLLAEAAKAAHIKVAHRLMVTAVEAAAGISNRDTRHHPRPMVAPAERARTPTRPTTISGAREIGELLPGKLEQEAAAMAETVEIVELCIPVAAVAADMEQAAAQHPGAAMAAAAVAATAEMAEKAIYTVLAAAVVTARWEPAAREAAPVPDLGKMAASLLAVAVEVQAVPVAVASR